MKLLRVIPAVLVLALWSVQAHAQFSTETCKRPNSTLLSIKLESGFRVSFALNREGNQIKGRAQAWQVTGVTAGQGNVTGHFNGDSTSAGQTYLLEVYWELRKDLTSTWFRGNLRQGEGNGTALDLDRGVAHVGTTATTVKGCERWPEQFSTASFVQASPQVEPGIDRPGADYRNFDLATSSYESCRAACEADQQCNAYTYVKPGVQGSKARCWLKENVPASRASDCCLSGVIRKTVSTPRDPVKMAPGLGDIVQRGGTASSPVAASPIVSASIAASQQIEMNIDRPGNDYRNFDLPTASHESCRVACSGDAKCKAYTYVKPSVQGPKARCWLKDNISASRASDCCVSGVIRTASGAAVTSAPRPIKKLGKRPTGPDPNIDYGGAPKAASKGTLVK